MSEQEGWTDFGGQSRKFHYIPADNDRALCGKWGLSPFVENPRRNARLQPDNGKRSPDDCAACRRKFDARSKSPAEHSQEGERRES